MGCSQGIGGRWGEPSKQIPTPPLFVACFQLFLVPKLLKLVTKGHSKPPPRPPPPPLFPPATSYCLTASLAEETRPWPFCFANLRCTARRRSAGLQRRPANKGKAGLGHLAVPCDAGLPESGCAAGETCHGGMRSSASTHDLQPVPTSILTAKGVTLKGAFVPSRGVGMRARESTISGSPPHRSHGGAWRCVQLEMQR